MKPFLSYLVACLLAYTGLWTMDKYWDWCAETFQSEFWKVLFLVGLPLLALLCAMFVTANWPR
jgi:hypothetical protein